MTWEQKVTCERENKRKEVRDEYERKESTGQRRRAEMREGRRKKVNIKKERVWVKVKEEGRKREKQGESWVKKLHITQYKMVWDCCLIGLGSKHESGGNCLNRHNKSGIFSFHNKHAANSMISNPVWASYSLWHKADSNNCNSVWEEIKDGRWTLICKTHARTK